MGKYIDLHTHSLASDGTLTPALLVRKAAEAGLCAFALTDHDTTNGLLEAERACAQYQIEFIRGIELNADYDGEMHILGLFIDETNQCFQDAMLEMKRYRGHRNEIMVDNLKKDYPITIEDVCALKQGGAADNIGRIHMALWLVQHGYFSDVRDVFDTLLGTGKPAYFARQRYSPRECIELIHHAGGLAFLAHPYLIAPTRELLLPIVKELKACGLDGMECLYSSQTVSYESMCRELCRTHSLLVSGGSDFHGENKPHVEIGRIYGGRRIKYGILQNIKDFLAQ